MLLRLCDVLFSTGQVMLDDRNKMAALNNAEWCAAVWRSHGLPVEQAYGMWFCPRPTPQYYPNVVTVDAEAEPTKQASLPSLLGTMTSASA
jgi:hypothetical protein